jgi:Site-specific recombinases, DNA invertase Pin homologs
MKYGYIRVSSKEQNIDRQMTALLQAGISEKQIFIDKVSGKDFKRGRYRALLRKMGEEDELYVKAIDRLGRNYEEIIEQWNLITKIKNVHIIVIDCPLLDTRQQINGVTGKFMADLVLQILSYVAQVERENTHQRQMEGIQEAQNKGIKFGRPAMNLPEEFEQVADSWKQGGVSLRKGARMLGVDSHTFAKWLRQNCIEKGRI